MSDGRQAVIVIHGMGEQRPMSTLREFADGVIPPRPPDPSAPDDPAYWSRPDDLSDSFDLRRYVVPSTRTRPVTDLFEFYWADKMTGTRWQHLLPLVRALLLRSPRTLRGSVRPFWFIGWVVLLGGVAVAGMTVAQRGPLALLDSPADLVAQWRTPATGDGPTAAVQTSSLLGWLTLAAVVLLGFGQTLAISSFGDVARYLDNAPGNVGVRHEINAAARDILRKLHESGRYDRIIVVGHSLGSIIGLNMIMNYWAEVHHLHGHPALVDQTALHAVEDLGPQVRDVEAYQRAQAELWREQRRSGVPWLVSDFITVGSPLSHAEWLMAGDREDLRARMTRRELPTVPPQPDNSGARGLSYPESYDTALGQRRTIFLLHHAAAFAGTRWTNVWFPARAGVFGDPFGGPVAPVFGPGVADRPVTAGPVFPRFLPVLAHTKYWTAKGASATGEYPDRHHLQLLRQALGLSRP